MSLAGLHLLVAAADAKFVMSYARWDLTPDGGGSWHVARMLPPVALEMLWLAAPMKPVGAGPCQLVTDKGQAPPKLWPWPNGSPPWP